MCVYGDNLPLKKSLRVLTALLKVSESHADKCALHFMITKEIWTHYLCCSYL